MSMRFSAAAEIDLEEIASWLSDNAGNAAFKIVRGLRESCRTLSTCLRVFRLLPAVGKPVSDGAFTATI